jgi:hypothetical protein
MTPNEYAARHKLNPKSVRRRLRIRHSSFGLGQPFSAPFVAPFVVEAHETASCINNFVEMLQISLVWYSWVGSNHRPVPQIAFYCRRAYAIVADSTKTVIISTANRPDARLSYATICIIVVASW